MKINFFSVNDGVELACLELSRVPIVGEFIVVDGHVQRIKAVVWTIKKDALEAVQVFVRDLRPTDDWRR